MTSYKRDKKCIHCGKRMDECVCLGITKTVITEENSYVIDGERIFAGLGGAVVVRLGEIVSEWN